MALRRTLVMAAAAALLIACQPKAPADAPGADLSAIGAHTVTGQVVRVEDGGYPRFTVTMRPDGAAEELLLSLNAEAATLGELTPEGFTGKKAEVSYTVTERPQLLDIKRGGQSLLPPVEEQPAADTPLTVSGVLSGAEAVTAGDLPDEITVTDAAGKATVFEYFITPEIVAANGGPVEATYILGREEDVTAMKLVP